DTLSWSMRGANCTRFCQWYEYIHEHTVPVYIHRDIKSANILIDKNFHAKFGEAHNHPNPIEAISRLIDPKLEDNYPFDSVHKMVQLAQTCTEKDHEMRPTMKSVVVALMALSLSTEG
uniref:Protein kinase domain-containing protein n=1 Tax=Solanum lycopersicum TaxID=4081 RepID=A0A3Q7EMX7_SOLLC